MATNRDFNRNSGNSSVRVANANLSSSTSSSNGRTLTNNYADLMHRSSEESTSYITQPNALPSIVITNATSTNSFNVEEISLLSHTNMEYVLDHHELKKFAIQIACGMKHLEEKQITHRYFDVNVWKSCQN